MFQTVYSRHTYQHHSQEGHHESDLHVFGTHDDTIGEYILTYAIEL